MRVLIVDVCERIVNGSSLRMRSVGTRHGIKTSIKQAHDKFPDVFGFFDPSKATFGLSPFLVR